MLTFGSFCSGIEAATAAFEPLGWKNLYLGEIEPFPCAVLAYRHGATRPLRMPDPDAPDLKEEDRKARRAAIRALDKIDYWGDRVPNFGDMTQIVAEELPEVDVLVAGTPCQDFSIAGLRAGLDGERGNLTLTFVRLVHELVALRRIRAVLWENVPDVLNDKTNAFGAFLGGLLGHDAPLRSNLKGGRWGDAGVADGPLGKVAWRVEDAQYSGLAQRRERVFVVASFGALDPVSVLFERRGLHGNTPPSREPGQGSAHDVAPSLTASGRGVERPGESRGQDPVVAVQHYLGNAEGGATDLPFLTLSNIGKTVNNQTPLVGVEAPEAAGQVYSIMPMNSGKDYKARPVDVAQPLLAAGPGGSGAQGGDFVVAPVNDGAPPVCFTQNARDEVRLVNGDGADAGDISPTLRAMGHGASHPNAGGQVAIAFSLRGREGGAMPEVDADGIASALRAAEGGSSRPYVASTMAVRRLTPVECERLQGFPDNHTLIPWPTANRKGRELEETMIYLTKVHGYSAEEAAVLAQTPDGPRYRALGNSKAVPLVRKIGAAMQAAWPEAA